jgi:hypothetical protein
MTTPLDRIAIDPQVCFGKPCIKGTRIWVSLILDFLASGESEAQILAAARAGRHPFGTRLRSGGRARAHRAGAECGGRMNIKLDENLGSLRRDFAQRRR